MTIDASTATENVRPAAARAVTIVILALGILVLGAIGYFVWHRYLYTPSFEVTCDRLEERGGYDGLVSPIAVNGEVPHGETFHERCVWYLSALGEQGEDTARCIHRYEPMFWMDCLISGRVAE